MLQLGVNIDHIATVRQARGTAYPSPIQAAMLAETAGADAITLHLREDRRHIQDRDVEMLRELLQTRMNLELAISDEMVDFALRIQPHDACLVPETRQELTTEGGLDVVTHFERVRTVCKKLEDAGIRVSLFIDPEEKQLEAAHKIGAPVVELHTGRYADAVTPGDKAHEFSRLVTAAAQGRASGLRVNAGHGLHYHNVQRIAAIPELEELNIGHAIVAQALFTGWVPAIVEMKRLMTEARRV